MKVMGYDIEGGGVGSPTLDEAVARAKQFDALVAGGGYKKYAAAMKSANPNLKLMIYTNGTHSTSNAFPEAWYLHDKNGNRIHAGEPWTGNLAMNPLPVSAPWRNAAGKTFQNWTEFRIDSIITLCQTSGYNACYVDEMGLGVITNTTSAPLGTIGAIDPRTNLPWTKNDWMAEMSDFLIRITNAVNLPVWCNGLGSNYRFYAAEGATSTLLSADGAAAELYMRGPTQAINQFPTLTWWGKELQMTIDCGPKLMTLTKTWTDGTKAEKDLWHRFSLGTFLVGSNNNAYYYFTYDRAATVTAFHPWWGRARALGAPTEVGHPNGSGWSRTYEHGVAFVNPNVASVSFPSVPAGLKLNNTSFPGGSLVVPAHSGEIIRF